uniref:Uncharacterized protein n=1 Tax=Rhizophora mucronata TaxID=61149 RepID=A0A2P2PSL7_RHIMU
MKKMQHAISFFRIVKPQKMNPSEQLHSRDYWYKL